MRPCEVLCRRGCAVAGLMCCIPPCVKSAVVAHSLLIATCLAFQLPAHLTSFVYEPDSAARHVGDCSWFYCLLPLRPHQHCSGFQPRFVTRTTQRMRTMMHESAGQRPLTSACTAIPTGSEAFDSKPVLVATNRQAADRKGRALAAASHPASIISAKHASSGRQQNKNPGAGQDNGAICMCTYTACVNKNGHWKRSAARQNTGIEAGNSIISAAPSTNLGGSPLPAAAGPAGTSHTCDKDARGTHGATRRPPSLHTITAADMLRAPTAAGKCVEQSSQSSQHTCTASHTTDRHEQRTLPACSGAVMSKAGGAQAPAQIAAPLHRQKQMQHCERAGTSQPADKHTHALLRP